MGVRVGGGVLEPRHALIGPMWQRSLSAAFPLLFGARSDSFPVVFCLQQQLNVTVLPSCPPLCG